VRDPRTGTQVRGVRRVLAGGIHDFLVAAVPATQAAATHAAEEAAGG
jgi:hypothetical protein